MKKSIVFAMLIILFISMLFCDVNTNSKKGQYDIYQAKTMRTSEK